MRISHLLLFCAIPGLALAQTAANPDAPVIHYKHVAAWPAPLKGDKGLPAGPWNFIQVTSVAVKKDGNVLVMHRGDDPVLEYRPDGTLVGAFGDVKFNHGKVMPMLKEVAAKSRTPQMSGYQAVYGLAGCSNCGAHEIRVDPDGNVWVVDAPSHLITKMSPQGKTLMTLDTRDKSGQNAASF